MGRQAILLLTTAMTAALVAGLIASTPASAIATPFIVNTTADPGTPTTVGCDAAECTLREAIEEANANNNAPTIDTITFNISGNGPHTISPISELPEITEPLIIDGYSQTGASPNTLAVGNDAVLKIELSGTSMPSIPANSLVSALRITAASSTVKGLIISNWNQENGVFLEGGATGNKVEGNFIGTDASGINSLGNLAGVISNGDNNTIGGTTADKRNIISGNGAGVQIGSANEGNKVQGNYIGTNKDGTSTPNNLGNNNGVVIIGSPNNTIGGTTTTARNIISGNFVYGIQIFGDGATDNQVQGNYIGTDASGTQPLGNGLVGVAIQQGAANNTIGGTKATAGNIISNNGNSSGADPNLNTLSGVEIQGSNDPMATGNRILSNSIYDNARLGIDLVYPTDPPGVTCNDDGDPDGGSPPQPATFPNRLQNFPEITSAKLTTKRIGGHRRKVTIIKGTLNSTPSTATTTQTFTLQFFGSPEADGTPSTCGPSGFGTGKFGEGKMFLGQKSVKTDSSGNATFTFSTKKKVPKGQVVTATATNQTTGDTSEFSEAVVVS
jgi:CSLREA domain-containing protein